MGKGKIKCDHAMLFLSTHPSFKEGWLCADCKQHVEIDLKDYVVVLAALKTKGKPLAPEGEPGEN